MMTLISKGFRLTPDAFDDVNRALSGVPSFVQEYGQPHLKVEGLHWMSYALPGDRTPGSISFTRNTAANLPNLVQCVYQFLQSLLPKEVLNPNYIHLLRTTGDVLPHVDEIRKSCINIGLLSADAATTWCALPEGNLDNFADNSYPSVCENGSAYLLNVLRPHAVYAKPGRGGTQRLLVTHSFGQTYEELLHLVKPT
jgi:hypothetical protein